MGKEGEATGPAGGRGALGLGRGVGVKEEERKESGSDRNDVKEGEELSDYLTEKTKHINSGAQNA